MPPAMRCIRLCRSIHASVGLERRGAVAAELAIRSELELGADVNRLTVLDRVGQRIKPIAFL